jgi:ankyrin repeat protein
MPIHYAAVEGHREIVSLLLDRGADINSITEVINCFGTIVLYLHINILYTRHPFRRPYMNSMKLKRQLESE